MSPSIDQLNAQSRELNRVPLPDLETPLLLLIAVSLLLWMLVSTSLEHAGGAFAAARATVAPYVSVTMTVLFLACAWMMRRFHNLAARIGASQASFDAWASRQNWGVDEWARIARSLELSFAFTLRARRWLEAQGQAAAKPASISNEAAVPAVLRAEPSLALLAQHQPALLIALALALPAVPLGAAVVSSWVLHASRGTVEGLVMGACLVGLIAVALIALTRLQPQAQASAIAALALPTEEWVRIEASSQLHEEWRPLIREHLNRTSRGWSLSPPPS